MLCTVTASHIKTVCVSKQTKFPLCSMGPQPLQHCFLNTYIRSLRWLFFFSVWQLYLLGMRVICSIHLLVKEIITLIFILCRKCKTHWALVCCCCYGIKIVQHWWILIWFLMFSVSPALPKKKVISNKLASMLSREWGFFGICQDFMQMQQSDGFLPLMYCLITWWFVSSTLPCRLKLQHLHVWPYRSRAAAVWEGTPTSHTVWICHKSQGWTFQKFQSAW